MGCGLMRCGAVRVVAVWRDAARCGLLRCGAVWCDIGLGGRDCLGFWVKHGGMRWDGIGLGLDGIGLDGMDWIR